MSFGRRAATLGALLVVRFRPLHPVRNVLAVVPPEDQGYLWLDRTLWRRRIGLRLLGRLASRFIGIAHFALPRLIEDGSLSSRSKTISGGVGRSGGLASVGLGASGLSAIIGYSSGWLYDSDFVFVWQVNQFYAIRLQMRVVNHVSEWHIK